MLLKELVISDYTRYKSSKQFFHMFKIIFFSIGFKVALIYRITNNLATKKYLLPFFLLFKYIQHRQKIRYGIHLPHKTTIGYGLLICHFGGIVISPKAVIGNNCNISHGVTIGKGGRGLNSGVPKIEDNVYIGPGATIIGNITIGSNSAIGANAVVSKDVPENSTIISGKSMIVSYKGSFDFIHNKYTP